MEVVRITLQEDVTITVHAKTREPLHSLACENFSRFHQQDEHNASCFDMSATQSPPKNRRKDTTFWSDKRNFYLSGEKNIAFSKVFRIFAAIIIPN